MYHIASTDVDLFHYLRTGNAELDRTGREITDAMTPLALTCASDCLSSASAWERMGLVLGHRREYFDLDPINSDPRVVATDSSRITF